MKKTVDAAKLLGFTLLVTLHDMLDAAGINVIGCTYPLFFTSFIRTLVIEFFS